MRRPHDGQCTSCASSDEAELGHMQRASFAALHANT
jgi:hypothetical protein